MAGFEIFLFDIVLAEPINLILLKTMRLNHCVVLFPAACGGVVQQLKTENHKRRGKKIASKR